MVSTELTRERCRKAVADFMARKAARGRGGARASPGRQAGPGRKEPAAEPGAPRLIPGRGGAGGAAEALAWMLAGAGFAALLAKLL